MFRSRHSVRGTLLLVIGLLALVTLVMAAAHLAQGALDLRAALRMAESNRFADACLAAARDFAFERGRTNVLLRAKTPFPPNFRQFLDHRRAGASEAMEQVLSLPLADDVRERGQIAPAWAEVLRLRRQADRDLALSLAERDPALPDRWLHAANAVLDLLEHATMASAPSANANAVFDRMLALRVIVMQFRNVVGLESSHILSALDAGGVPDRDVLSRVYILRGRSEQLWMQLDQQTALLGNPEFSQSLDQVRVNFFDGLRRLEDQTLADLTRGAPQAVTAKHYAESSIKALDSIVLSLESIKSVAAAYTEANTRRARQTMLVNLGVIGLCAALVVAAMGVITRRMSKPLGEIADRITRQLHCTVDPPDNKDEIGLVQSALDLLDKSLAERERDASALREAHDKLARLAITDELTGLSNRRHFNERLETEWARARRNGTPLAVLMLDIDYFKKYNDRYGHQAGDDCLAQVACALRARLRRPGDLAARYGGEEFVVISANTNREQAETLAQNIRLAVESLQRPHGDSPFGRITVSIGAASLIPTGSLSPHFPVNLADNALYEAKEAGRNRVALTAGFEA